MKQYDSVKEMVSQFAISNIGRSSEMDIKNEINFINKHVLLFKNRLDAIRKYGIESKIWVIEHFGFVKI